MKPTRKIPSSDDYSATYRDLSRSAQESLRAVGIDDGPSKRSATAKSCTSHASLVAVWFDQLRFDQIRIGVLEVDGLDSTNVILKLLRGIRTDIIFLSGITFAGFNIVDSTRLHNTLHIPLIVVCREQPDNSSVKRALQKHFTDWEKRWELVRKFGRIYSFAPKPSEQPLHFEAVGISAAQAKKVISVYCATSRIPEPIRVAGIVAKGLALSGAELNARSHEVGDAKLQRLKVHHREQTRRRF